MHLVLYGKRADMRVYQRVCITWYEIIADVYQSVPESVHYLAPVLPLVLLPLAAAPPLARLAGLGLSSSESERMRVLWFAAGL